ALPSSDSSLYFPEENLNAILGFKGDEQPGSMNIGGRHLQLKSMENHGESYLQLNECQPPFSLLLRKKHHVLVTLLLCNAAAMEALPLSLDKIFNPVAAVILSVTFVLFFGEILDCALGHADLSLFRRAQFKAFISIHSKETAEEAMTPIESTFSLDVNSKLDW
ncbi:putative DUF21 domain-containing protein At1g03270, partial [Phalaenopsis equestris]|uniref:putative DUF21 domain-containing protein At1g03270 n=1 Tax=Phalaenopsis equestris TaxID=78828 RepID=UPI0009E50B65